MNRRKISHKNINLLYYIYNFNIYETYLPITLMKYTGFPKKNPYQDFRKGRVIFSKTVFELKTTIYIYVIPKRILHSMF